MFLYELKQLAGAALEREIINQKITGSPTLKCIETVSLLWVADRMQTSFYQNAVCFGGVVVTATQLLSYSRYCQWLP